MKITELMTSNIILAPMAGYTDVGFRALCRKYGAGLTVTEMVSAKALTYQNPITLDLLKTKENEWPKCVQLFGHEADVFKEAVMLPQIQEFDIIDINMGCPMPKIFNNGDGCALMQSPNLASKIILAVKSSKKFVTVKFRLGISDDDITAVSFAKMCQDSGADAITIHGRTREQYYSGVANHKEIEKAAEEVKIPVFANGDIKSRSDVLHFAETACFGVSVARAAEGRPSIFAELSGKTVSVDLYSDILFHIDAMSYLPEKVAVNEMKKHIAVYLKGLVGHKIVTDKVCHAQTLCQLKQLLKDFLVTN
ncbi:MAG: tRNA-dihydrouridine synthase [Clostridia bacterium]